VGQKRRPPLIHRSPFIDDNSKSVIEVKARGTEKGRSRRLVGDEEDRLANKHLCDLITAALDTGCRVGELLSLQWKDIHVDDERDRWILMLSEEKTKTACDRQVPVMKRLRSILEMRRHVPAEPKELRDALGDEYGPDHYVLAMHSASRSRQSVRRGLRRAVAQRSPICIFTI
jgi:integrase